MSRNQEAIEHSSVQEHFSEAVTDNGIHSRRQFDGLHAAFEDFDIDLSGILFANERNARGGVRWVHGVHFARMAESSNDR